MISSISFDYDLSGKSFQRNNRSTGQKSLRCFPVCRERGHKAHGFCGTPIYATAVLQKTTVAIERMLIVGEIRPELEPGLANEVGSEFPKCEFLNRIRSADTGGQNARLDLLPGMFSIASETPSEYKVHIVINEPLHSYDYSWKSNRWADKVKHVVDIVVLCLDDGDTVTVLDSATSGSFVVVSTKKPRQKERSSTSQQSEEVIQPAGKKREHDPSLDFGPSSSKKINNTNFHSPLSSLSAWNAEDFMETTSPISSSGGGSEDGK